MKRGIHLLVLTLLSLHAFAQYSWQTLPSFPGAGRHHAIGFSHSGKGYVMTGNSNTGLTKDFYEFDTLTMTWTQLPDYPGPVRGYGIGAVINDTAYIGLGYTGTTDLIDWWAYDFSTATWTQKNNIPLPPRRHPTAVSLNGKLYTGMGDNGTGTQFRDWWEYDPATDSWIQKSNYPGITMHHPVCCTDGNLIYLSEGHLYNGSVNMGSTDVYSYDPANDLWTQLADMPGPGVVAGASFNIGNKIYSGDGITEPVETWHNEFYEYNISTGIWDTIAPYPGVGNFGPVYFSIGNSGYVVTGSTGAAGTGEFYRYAPPLPIDAGIISVSAATSCGTVDATVDLKNFGVTTITSATINFRVDNNTPQAQSWSGSLAQNATTSVTIPTQTVSVIGAHTFTAWVSNPNTVADMNAGNDQGGASFINFPSSAVNIPVTESFASTSFPPSGWILSDPDSTVGWARKNGTGGFGNSTSCAWIDFYNYSGSGQQDFLCSPTMNFQSLTGTPNMTFSIAYAPYDATFCDQLDIDVTTDCGMTWTNVYSKACTVLQTANAATSAFTPTAAQWRTDTVNLTSFIGNNEVIVRFKTINGYGNDLFIDDINIDNSMGIEVLNAGTDINLYPNPVQDELTLRGNCEGELHYVITDVLGAEVESGIYNASGSYQLQIPVMDLANGTYFLNVSSNAGVSAAKFIKQ